MKNIFFVILIAFIFYACKQEKQSLLIEAEQFDNTGGWVIDQQFIPSMGSAYLLAHGMGQPVANARTWLKAVFHFRKYHGLKKYHWIIK